MVFNLMLPATVEEIKHEKTAAIQTMTPEIIYSEFGTSSSIMLILLECLEESILNTCELVSYRKRLSVF